ncbi:MAG: transcriptional regulator [Stappia sp.]|uniref:sigma-54-dependent Fis family transcriptional regulator n=1 Tax=Stappia sp. TaxID=1870903 RepID=UPI000C4340F4|nr:sigma-54-dependent Fis family transcriptional regulator [Stappia sp.]MAB00835.1 transcriptional regulator [Stappia sp.]MBM18964.1 transcriptional regulator [Stappia sp.]
MSDIEHVDEIGRVLRGQPTGRDDLVTTSWRRCVETYGMDPTRPEPAHIVTDTQLRAHQEQAERLIATARSGLRALFRQVAGQNYVLLLADADGICVDFFGDPRFEDDLRQAGLYLGSDWSEDLAGTCGVGSCLVTGKAVTIHQDDHFGLAHTPLSCTAAPIYDTCGKLSAVLDISLLRSPSPKSSQNLAMNLVKASARRVEMANLMAMTRRDWVLRLSTSPEFLEVDPEAAIALDASGRIIGMTQGALECLAPSGADTLIGMPMEALTEHDIDDLPDYMRGRPSEERVLRLKDGRGLFAHAIAPQVARLPRKTSATGGTAATARTGLPAPLESLSGPDPALARLLERAARLAPTSVPLMLCGETGTGKARLARAIHVCGNDAGTGGSAAAPSRQALAFHGVHCAGLDATAVARLADLPAGTLFLRGIEDLEPAAQSALIGLLDARSDLRPITTTSCATTGSEETSPAPASLRPDLHFRLAGAVLALPPLRLRRDLDWLVERLLRRRPEEFRLSPAARAELCGRDWPGNIRELAHALDVAMATATDLVIDLNDLPPPTFRRPPPSGFMLPTPRSAARPGAAGTSDDELEALLEACHWNMSQVARRLGVNRSTILRRVRKAGLTPPD